jgi:hypothetical protein
LVFNIWHKSKITVKSNKILDVVLVDSGIGYNDVVLVDSGIGYNDVVLVDSGIGYNDVVLVDSGIGYTTDLTLMSISGEEVNRDNISRVFLEIKVVKSTMNI